METLSPYQLSKSILLSPVLDMPAAEQLFATLQAVIAEGRPATIDGREVEWLSTPCVQVLLATLRAAAVTHIPLHLQVSDEMRRSLEDFGLMPEFERWMA